MTPRTPRQNWNPNFTVLFKSAWRGSSKKGLRGSFRLQEVTGCRSKNCNLRQAALGIF